MRDPIKLGPSLVFLSLSLLACGPSPSKDAPGAAGGPVSSAPGGTKRQEAPRPEPPLPAPDGEVRRVAVPGIEVVRRYTEQFYAGELEPLYERFSPELKGTFPLERLRALQERVRREFGREVRVIAEDGQVKGDYRGFARWARFDGYDGVVRIEWILRPDDSIGGLFFKTSAPPEIDDAGGR